MESTTIRFYIPIIGWPNRFVSDDGTVISLTRKLPKIMKGSVDKAGYCFITTRLAKGVSSNRYRHRLVAEAFLPNPENLPQVNHKDGDKSNNCVTNLEWCSPRENTKHAIEKGLRRNFGEGHGCAVLSELDVKEALLLHSHGFSVKYIANWLSVSRGIICKIVNNQTWRHIER